MDSNAVKLILGLGNPGDAYADNRHNAGFMALEAFARDPKEPLGPPSNFKSSRIATGRCSGVRVVLAWPQTYMNLSGHAARELVSFYKIDALEDMLVVHDEMDLPPGRVKATRGGGSAGHNGIDSVKEAVPQDFARLRIGVGRPPKAEGEGPSGSKDWVLSPFADEEIPLVEEALKAACGLMRVWIEDGLSAAQRLGNRKPKKPKPEKGAGEGAPEAASGGKNPGEPGNSGNP
jgi:PTH1 family peptidyl-tRNA hydrolase